MLAVLLYLSCFCSAEGCNISVTMCIDTSSSFRSNFVNWANYLKQYNGYLWDYHEQGGLHFRKVFYFDTVVTAHDHEINRRDDFNRVAMSVEEYRNHPHSSTNISGCMREVSEDSYDHSGVKLFLLGTDIIARDHWKNIIRKRIDDITKNGYFYQILFFGTYENYELIKRTNNYMEDNLIYFDMFEKNFSGKEKIKNICETSVNCANDIVLKRENLENFKCDKKTGSVCTITCKDGHISTERKPYCIRGQWHNKNVELCSPCSRYGLNYAKIDGNNVCELNNCEKEYCSTPEECREAFEDCAICDENSVLDLNDKVGCNFDEDGNRCKLECPDGYSISGYAACDKKSWKSNEICELNCENFDFHNIIKVENGCSYRCNAQESPKSCSTPEECREAFEDCAICDENSLLDLNDKVGCNFDEDGNRCKLECPGGYYISGYATCDKKTWKSNEICELNCENFDFHNIIKVENGCSYRCNAQESPKSCSTPEECREALEDCAICDENSLLDLNDKVGCNFDEDGNRCKLECPGGYSISGYATCDKKTWKSNEICELNCSAYENLFEKNSSTALEVFCEKKCPSGYILPSSFTCNDASSCEKSPACKKIAKKKKVLRIVLISGTVLQSLALIASSFLIENVAGVDIDLIELMQDEEHNLPYIDDPQIYIV